MHGARSAKRDTTAEFGAAHAEHVAQHPEQRGIGIDIDAVRGSVNLYSERRHLLILETIRPCLAFELALRGIRAKLLVNVSASSECKHAAIADTLETNDREEK